MTGEEIKSLRIGSLLTQEEFAEAIGVSSTSVCLWERGARSPGLRHRRALRDFQRRVAAEQAAGA